MLGWKTFGDDILDQPGCKDGHHDCDQCGNDECKIQHSGENVPGGFATVFFHKLREDRDQGDAQRPAGNQRGEQVWDIVGGIEYIQFVGEPEQPVDHGCPDKTEDFIYPEKEGENKRGAR